MKQQAKDLGLQAILKVTNTPTPSQSYTAINQGATEPYLQFKERLQDALEKQIVDKEAKEQIVHQSARDHADEELSAFSWLLLAGFSF